MWIWLFLGLCCVDSRCDSYSSDSELDLNSLDDFDCDSDSEDWNLNPDSGEAAL